MPAAFSRLQLAAALLEYDNDPDDPHAPRRLAKESAIFAHLRRNPAARPHVASRKSDYLVSETGSIAKKESASNTRRSRTSRTSDGILRNPFGADDYSEYDEERRDEGTELEVDLASWGLDAFIPKDKSKSKGKAKQPTPPAIVSVQSHKPSTNHDPTTSPRRALGASRSLSVGGNLDYFGGDAEPSARMPSSLVDEHRRRSFSTPLELAGMQSSNISYSPQRRRAASQSSISALQPPSIPFPSVVDSSMPLDPRPLRDQPTEDNEYSSRSRVVSNGTLETALRSDNPFELGLPSRMSRFDPKAAAHTRTMSNATIGSRMLLDNDGLSVSSGDLEHDRPYSTMELLRPKVLVMPSPLQPISMNTPQDSNRAHDGFELSTDGPPLPPGARSSRASLSLSAFEAPPIASNSFTPNPVADLSLSQKTFRGTLMVNGERDILDMDRELPRATEEGEQAQLNSLGVDETFQMSLLEEEYSKPSRPAGKLYGKSLIDDLENRKAQMRSKQRVFTGDQRPSMMARNLQRASTLIDPASLQARPTNQRLNSYGSQEPKQTVVNRNSVNIKPLLNFEDGSKALQPSTSANRNIGARSVFGVDTLWEREMAKLHEMQASEKIESEQRIRREEEEAKKKAEKEHRRKRKRKGKGGNNANEKEQSDAEPRSVTLPLLPDVRQVVRKTSPRPSDNESTSESDDVAEIAGRNTEGASVGWHAGSSDEEDNKIRRTTGTGPRYPLHARKASDPQPRDSEDEPFATTLRRTTRLRPPHERTSDDEDEPLVSVLRKTKIPNLPSMDINFDGPPSNARAGADDEDDQPLGLRASRLVGSSGADDDDRPLAYHPEQQRRTQYQMLAHHHQQQQQHMIHAQLQNSLFFNQSMMGSGFFVSPMMNPMALMQPPVPIPSPPPIHDEAKLVRVDRWRRDVTVDGEP